MLGAIEMYFGVYKHQINTKNKAGRDPPAISYLSVPVKRIGGREVFKRVSNVSAAASSADLI